MKWLDKIFVGKTAAHVIEKYKEYRKISKELNNKIMNTCLDRDVFIKAARLLGAARGEVITLDDENEMNILMDFALRDYKASKLLSRYIGRKLAGKMKSRKRYWLHSFHLTPRYSRLFPFPKLKNR